MGDIKNQALFSVIFEDGTQFAGGNSYYEPKWKEIPDKTIKHAFFLLPDGNFFILHDYEKYLYLVEGAFDANGKNKGKLKIENLYFMGLRNGLVDSYRTTMSAKGIDRYKVGDITKRQYKWEEIKNKYTGWK